MAIYDIVEGTTSAIQFQLLEAGAPINLTGFTVTLLLEDNDGTVIASPGTVSVVDATTGKVQLLPTDTSVFDPDNGPYYARWKITDVNSKISYVPTSIRDVWNIVAQ